MPFVPMIHQVPMSADGESVLRTAFRGECRCTARKNRVRTYAHVQAEAPVGEPRLMGGRSICIGKAPAREVHASCSAAFTSFRKDCSALLTRTPPKPRNPPSLDAFAAFSDTLLITCL